MDTLQVMMHDNKRTLLLVIVGLLLLAEQSYASLR
ncbi:unnamed protein product [Haemonchus placei]|uniref:GOLD domain-containing protein n=1 Tax=Haemonchus placei TaxID=6290 RepID=A0A0N4WTU2_HAEPC|nr:unnamed protein product [Haemonchus placei]